MKIISTFLILLFLPSILFSQEGVILKQDGAPIKIETLNVNFESGFDRISFETTLYNSSEQPITAYQIDYFAFDIFDNLISEYFSGSTIEALNTGFGGTPEYIFESDTLGLIVLYGQAVAFISKVRFMNGETWEFEKNNILDQLQSIDNDVDSTVFSIEPKVIFKGELEPVTQIESIIIPQSDSPINVDEFQASYDELKEEIQFDLNFYSNVDREILAYQLSFIQFDSFGSVIEKPFNGFTIEKLKYGYGESSEWKFEKRTEDVLHKSGKVAVIVTRIRFGNGEVWDFDKNKVLEELKKIGSDFDKSFFEKF